MQDSKFLILTIAGLIYPISIKANSIINNNLTTKINKSKIQHDNKNMRTGSFLMKVKIEE